MKTFKWILLSLLLIIILTAGYIYYSYATRSQAKAKDLGVSYTIEDYNNAVYNKAGVEVPVPEDIYFGSNFKTEGSKYIEETFSDAEISAIQNYSNEKKGPFKDVQIHFLENNQIEASGFVTNPKVNAPVYVKGWVAVTGNKSVSVKVKSLKVGNLPIPSAIIDMANTRFVDYVNGILNDIDLLKIESIQTTSGSATFKGTIPQKVYGAN